ncbi:ABC transporter ATP-binding protein [Synoicihabitans lomoniglobus]|uniref:ABC transporter ATP-binding protein n=1 Tax=Synoicihabitans lomoniglobus TaxID=2909285 RepID=A0AAE9ZXW8_9BACT|nr:ABC transporter ATP-binding protein [Opitutaceae bacterium LMO-M01]WED65174.1 ABC transporter ATP-binding protein [Opitutaceae bacterium LMO-M01]
MIKPIIETQGLSKTYGSQRALDDVTVSLPPGTIGLLGPNGAGKTTFLKCLLNLEAPTAGTAQVLGRSITVNSRESRERVGYGPERDCHIPGMAGCEYVTYCGQLSGMTFHAARQRAHEMLDLVGMGQERYRSIDTYSTGMRQRAKLAQALVHDPEVLILDEPTNGLDPSGREYILRLIGSLWREFGISVIISSHLLHDIERICDRVLIIANGRIVEHETMAALQARRRRVVELAPSGAVARYTSVLTEAGFTVEALSNGRLRIESTEDSVDWLLRLMRDHDLPPADLFSSPDALQGLFLQALEASGIKGGDAL